MDSVIDIETGLASVYPPYNKPESQLDKHVERARSALFKAVSIVVFVVYNASSITSVVGGY